MAAFDTFANYVDALSDHERKLLGEAIQNERADLSAARSEEARVRIVQQFIIAAHNMLKSARNERS